jgi:spermidine synthase
MAVTTYLSTDIAAVPLLWIVPLGLYLLTFVAAFSSSGHVWRRPARTAFPLLLIPLALMMCTGARMPQALMFAPHVLAFVAAAFLCHGQLADGRPSSAHLTEFYLWISFGGMLGGLFNALAAPFMFNSVAEYPVVLVLACLMLPAEKPGTSDEKIGKAVGSGRDRVLDVAIPLAVGGSTALLAIWLSAQGALLLAALCAPAVIAFSQRRRPLRFGLSVGALLLSGITCLNAGKVLYAERTFFGVYRVQQDAAAQYIALAHGTTLHGIQATRGPERMEPLTYYHRLGPFGQAVAGLSRASKIVDRVAVIGLGVGTLAAYAEPTQAWTFYEIDPAVERIARDTRYFTFLQRCGDRCRVVIGDARLSLAHAAENQYDLLVLDAFSSDAIPVHLLTSEALSLYLTRLRPDGEILFHISNAHLALAPIVARLAQQHGLVALGQVDQRKADWPMSRSASSWVAMARHKEDLGTIGSDLRWKPLVASAATPLWTDDFSNILSVLQLR